MTLHAKEKKKSSDLPWGRKTDCYVSRCCSRECQGTFRPFLLSLFLRKDDRRQFSYTLCVPSIGKKVIQTQLVG